MKDKLQKSLRSIKAIVQHSLAKIALVSIAVGAVVIFVFLPRLKLGIPNSVIQTGKIPSVDLPTIVDGNLVLPKKDRGLETFSNKKLQDGASLRVMSANIIAVYDQSQGGAQHMSSIRIIGEVKNVSDGPVSSFQPVVRFVDDKGKVSSQKTGIYSESFRFHTLQPSETTFYDATVIPPTDFPERLEVILNADSASSSAQFYPLKIQNRDFEVKTASNSATGEKVEYYSVSGKVVNTTENYLTDIEVVAWVKDPGGSVFSAGYQVFKNDLLPNGEKLEFKIPLLPLKAGFKYESYGLEAWGKEFKLKI